MGEGNSAHEPGAATRRGHAEEGAQFPRFMQPEIAYCQIKGVFFTSRGTLSWGNQRQLKS